MYNRAEVEIEELTKRHQENFTIFPQGSDESIRPKEQHKQRGSEPNGNREHDNELQHF